MTTPAWVGKLHHELVGFMTRCGVRLTPAKLDELRLLLERSIGVRPKPDTSDDDTPTDPGWKSPSKH